MSNEKKTVINESTLLPISFVVLILIGVLRVESTASTARENEKKIEKLTEEMKVLQKINTRLSRIEGHLGVKTEDSE